MRSADYHDREATFGRLLAHQMVRVALVNRLNQRINPEHFREDRELVAEFTELSPREISQYSDIVSYETIKDPTLLDKLSEQLDYRSSAWRSLDFKVLEERGVIQETNGLDGLVNSSKKGEIHTVYVVREELLDPDVDWLKNIHWSRRGRLDSKKVIQRFAQERRVILPKSYPRTGRMTSSVLHFLDAQSYTFPTAVRVLFDEISTEDYDKKIFTCLSFNNPQSKRQVKFHLHNITEAAEEFAYRELKSGEQIIFEFKEPGSYAVEQAIVPKRRPRLDKTWNVVEASDMPNFDSDKGMNDWMYLQPYCSCENALNLRNYRIKIGHSVWSVKTADTHFLDMVFEILLHTQEQRWAHPKTIALFPSPETVGVQDFLRYNVYLELAEDSSLRRRALNEPEIEATLFRYGVNGRRENKDFSLFLGPSEVPSITEEESFNYLIRPMYFKPKIRK